ncbi:putative sensory transducer protein YvaQ [Lysinibacillus alkalisoli]|uniref:Sensory transducer protein YvaQ n=1 Tax=Lysinibacillus alkalisoli TaxID=1911548 RepID=A0A917D5S5_9BACI|nr:methyl-accepting chemotaxis protein [Lysinibacillus alkalisoli]GGG11834.1 putative sensory transducer protein YvaQ [Lysinibacillus alkalisoli]
MWTFKTVGRKMVFSFALILLMIIGLSLYTIYAMNKTHDTMKEITHEELPILIADEKLSFVTAKKIALARGYLLMGDKEYLTEYADYKKQGEELQTLLLANTHSDQVEQLITLSEEWQELVENTIFPLFDSGQEDEARELLTGEAQTYVRDIMAGFAELGAAREQRIQDEGKAVVKSGTNAILMTSIVVVFVILVSLIIAYQLTNSIVKPINTVKNRLLKIAEGDLSQAPLKVIGRDELAQLMTATNQLSERNNALLQKITHAMTEVTERSSTVSEVTDEISKGSNQIAITMTELATGATSQADLASNMVQSVERFNEALQEITLDSEKVHQQAEEVTDLSQSGHEVMNNSIQQMNVIYRVFEQVVVRVEKLEQQSNAIHSLVETIQAISDQTNLLALNAAIEAARAGDHGKGFAVVATEVKKLAEQVSHSVVDITDIIAGIQEETKTVTTSLHEGYEDVRTGTELLEKTNAMFNQIMEAIENITGNIRHTAQEITHLSQTSDAVRHSIEEQAAVTQQSAAGIEETTASAEESSSALHEVNTHVKQMSDASKELARLVDVYTLRQA